MSWYSAKAQNLMSSAFNKVTNKISSRNSGTPAGQWVLCRVQAPGSPWIRQQHKGNYRNADNELPRWSLFRLQSSDLKWNEKMTCGVWCQCSCRTKGDRPLQAQALLSCLFFSCVLKLTLRSLYFSGLYYIDIPLGSWSSKTVREIIYQLALVKQSYSKIYRRKLLRSQK